MCHNLTFVFQYTKYDPYLKKKKDKNHMNREEKEPIE